MSDTPPPPLPLPEDQVRSLGLAFEVGISEAFLRLNPESREALEMLGHALTRSGRHKEALETDRRLVILRPGNAFARYNLACSLSNMGLLEEALEELTEAVRLGYDDVAHMQADPDLQGVRKDPRFGKLMAKAGKKGR